MSTPIFCTRNRAWRLYQEKDYRTFLNRHRPEPDAFLLFGRRKIPLYLLESPPDQPTKD
jgi:hypothetical protein